MESAFITGKDSAGKEFYIEVDADMYDVLKEYNWRIRHHHNTQYAEMRVNALSKVPIRMHQFIIGTPLYGLVVDHKDGRGLNNTRENLRVVTCRQNGQNLHILKGCKFPGVRFRNGKYEARIRIGNERYSLGRYKTDQEAFDRYCTAAKLLGDSVL